MIEIDQALRKWDSKHPPIVHLRALRKANTWQPLLSTRQGSTWSRGLGVFETKKGRHDSYLQ